MIDKNKYRSLEFSGYTWFGFIEGLHHFQKRHENGKYSEMVCSEDCLTNGNAVYMAEQGLTYGSELVRKLNAKWRKKNA